MQIDKALFLILENQAFILTSLATSKAESMINTDTKEHFDFLSNEYDTLISCVEKTVSFLKEMSDTKE